MIAKIPGFEIWIVSAGVFFTFSIKVSVAEGGDEHFEGQGLRFLDYEFQLFVVFWNGDQPTHCHPRSRASGLEYTCTQIRKPSALVLTKRHLVNENRFVRQEP